MPYELSDLICKLKVRGYSFKQAYLQKQGGKTTEMWVLNKVSGTGRDVVLPVKDVVNFANEVVTMEEILKRIAGAEKNRKS
ncbi:MAG: hypothetical protein DMG05_11610 [Acidobacteria bacterium]|nr:MAG: hypothetical protein DMG05_11610 [Acidobacteriota bacterium]